MDEEKRGSSKRGAKIADLESGSLVVPPAQVMIMIRYRVIFLTGPPLKMSLDWPPPNLLGLAPPLISLSVGITFTSPDT